MKTRHWLHGLGAAVIGGGANAVTVIIIDPLKFNIQDGWKNLLAAVVVSSIVSCALYLKQSPLPPEE
jgi:hypothetical protein